MKKIKINVVDFGGDKRNFLTDILEEVYMSISQRCVRICQLGV